MKNMSKKIVSLVLALVMMASLLSVTASAATTKTVKTYKTYVDLGDSISTGFSLATYTRDNHWNEVPGSFPSYVAKYVKAKKSYWLSQDGFRTSEIRELLDNNYNGDLMTDYELPRNTENFWNNETLQKYRSKYQKAVKKANLITLNVGFNDGWFPILYMSHKLFPDQPLEAIVNYPTMLITVLQSAYQLMLEFYVNYSAIVTRIHELNPKATVVLVGNYNPIAGWAIPRDSQLAFGQLLTPYFQTMNTFKQNQADQYPNYYYADVMDVEVRTAKLPDADAGGFDPHPTEAGHRWMAKQIIKALPAKNAK